MTTRRIFVCGTLAGCVSSAGYSDQRSENALSPSLRSDGRLQASVSISRTQICVGELLDEISEKTGTRVEVADRIEPASGFQLAAYVRDRPAREVMEAICRLYDLPPVKWFWEKEQKGSKARYILNCSHSPGIWGHLRRTFAEDYTLDELRKQGDFLSLPPERRAATAQGDPFLQAVNRQFQRSAGFYSFVGGLDDDQLRSIIRGKRIEIPLAQLSRFQRDFIRSEFALANLGHRFDSLEKVRLISGDEERPGIFLDLGPPGAHGVAGSFALGQAMDSRDAQLEKNWIGKGESNGPFAQDIKSPQVLFDRNPTAAVQSLLQRLPDELRNPGRALICKRWSVFSLVRPKDWQLYHQEEAVPWPVIRNLRRAAVENEGYLRPDDWMRLTRLGPEQLEALGEEFPDAYQVRNFLAALRIAADLSGAQSRNLASEGGLTWPELPPAVRAQLAHAYGDRARGVKLMVRWQQTSPPKVTLTTSPVGGRIITLTFAKPNPPSREKLF